MKTEDAIKTMIRDHIAAKMGAGELVVVPWLTKEILENHSDISGGDSDFYRVCAHKFVDDAVKRAVGKYDANETAERQLVLTGFEHLQTGYTVKRDGLRVLVPTDKLTDEEMLARADEIESFAAGAILHAEEIRSYVEARNAEGQDTA